jgi:exodeoxyribonuclease VII large subunit
VQRRRDRVERVAHDLHLGVSRGAERRSARVSAIAGRLNALSPLATLARGYAVARDESGNTLGSTASFTPALDFDLLLRDGTVRATTRSVHPAPRNTNETPGVTRRGRE